MADRAIIVWDIQTAVSGAGVPGRPVSASLISVSTPRFTGTTPTTLLQPITNSTTTLADPGAGPVPAPVLSLNVGAGAATAGNYYGGVSYTINGVETAVGVLSNTVAASLNDGFHWAGIPLGPAGTTARTLYRTLHGGTLLHQVAVIADNTTTTYTDNTLSDAVLGLAAPGLPVGGWRLSLTAPGDITPSACFYLVSEDGIPAYTTAFVYGSGAPVQLSTITSSSSFAAPAVAMTILVATIAGPFDAGDKYQVNLSWGATSTISGERFEAAVPFYGFVSAAGLLSFLLPRNDQLTPSGSYYTLLRVQRGGDPITFTAIAGGGDIWVHQVGIGPPGTVAYNQTSLNSTITPLVDDPTQSPTTLADDIHNLDARTNGSLSTKTANYTVLATDNYLLGDATSAPFTFTLPSAAVRNRELIFKRTNGGPNAITIATVSSQTIDGAATYVLGSQYVAVRLKSNGTSWQVVGINTGPGSGTVTSVGMALPSTVFTVSGSPVTGSGTLTAVFTTQAVSTFLAGPSSGAAATPTFRGIVQSDLPGITVSKSGTAIGTRNTVNLIPGTNVTMTVADNSGANRVDVTINAAGGGGSSTSSNTTPPARVWQQTTVTPGAPTIPAGFPVTAISDGRYNQGPVLEVTRSGSLFLAYRDATGDTALGGLVVSQRSHDGGQTWGGKATIATPASLHDFREPALGITATGRLVLAAANHTGGSDYVIYSAYSDDDGVTWSNPLTSAITQPFSAWSYPTGRILCHSSGTLLMPVYGQGSGDTTTRSAVCISTDNGATWSAAGIGAVNSGYNEVGLVELPDHSVVAYCRQDNTNPGNYGVATSTDVGATWSSISAGAFTVRAGRNSPILVPVSQTLLLFYRSTTGPSNSVYRYSTDLGATWSSEQALDGLSTNLYFAVTQLSDHQIGMAWSQSNGSSTIAPIKFQPMAVGLPVVSGVRDANAALASLLGKLSTAGVIVDTTTAGSGPAAVFTNVIKSANYTVLTSDTGLLGDCSSGAITFTLPTAVGAHQQYTLGKFDPSTHKLTIAAQGGELVNSGNTFVISIKGVSITLGSDGTNWQIVTDTGRDVPMSNGSVSTPLIVFNGAGDVLTTRIY